MWCEGSADDLVTDPSESGEGESEEKSSEGEGEGEKGRMCIESSRLIDLPQAAATRKVARTPAVMMKRRRRKRRKKRSLRIPRRSLKRVSA